MLTVTVEHAQEQVDRQGFAVSHPTAGTNGRIWRLFDLQVADCKALVDGYFEAYQM
jgi:hypothetical protein